MRITARFASLLTVTLLTAPVLAGEQPHEQDREARPMGLVNVEVERSPELGPVSALTAGDWLLDPEEGFSLDWCSVVPRRRAAVAEGLGVVARSDGVIATARELIANATRITVALADGRRLEAEVASIHTDTHTALLRVEARDLAPALLRDVERELATGTTLALAGTSPEVNGIYTGRDASTGALTLLCSSAEAQLGAPIVTRDGHVVGLNATLSPLPLPLDGTLQVVTATPPERIRELMAGIPFDPPLMTLPPLEWSSLDPWRWGSWYSPPRWAPQD